MKLILTSIGLSNPQISQTFFNFIPKDLSQIKIAFVPTADLSEGKKENAEKSRQELVHLGIKPEHIQELDLNKPVSYNDFSDCDALYVCGGNTFFLMHKIRQSGFGKALLQFLEQDKVYIGVSAGSIIVTPSIAIASVEPADPNDIGLTDFTGLGITKFEVSPHVPEVVTYENCEAYSKTTKNKIYAFDHHKAVVVEDEKIDFVGPGESKIYNL